VADSGTGIRGQSGGNHGYKINVLLVRQELKSRKIKKNSRFPTEDRTHSHVAGRGVVEAAGGGVQAPDRFPSGHDLGAPGVRRGRDPDRSHSN